MHQDAYTVSQGEAYGDDTLQLRIFMILSVCEGVCQLDQTDYCPH